MRRRAAAAVNAGHICLDGTNSVLRRLDIPVLPREYTVELLVPVTVLVGADDDEHAYERAEEHLRGQLSAAGEGFDLAGIRRCSVTVTSEVIDLEHLD